MRALHALLAAALMVLVGVARKICDHIYKALEVLDLKYCLQRGRGFAVPRVRVQPVSTGVLQASTIFISPLQNADGVSTIVQTANANLQKASVAH